MKHRIVCMTALTLTAALLVSAFSACGLFGSLIGGKTSGDEKSSDSESPIFTDYYINTHTPTVLSGGVDIYKYQNKNDPVATLGGYDARGGVVLKTFVGPVEYADAEFPLNGEYDYFSFLTAGCYVIKEVETVKDGKEIYYAHMYACEGAYPTLVGMADEKKVGIRVLVDGEVKEEILLSSYDVAKRYTYPVTGAQKIEIKAVSGYELEIPLFEITASKGQPLIAGYTAQPAGSEAVKLVRDLKPYLIPASDAVEYYPNYASDKRNSIKMGGVTYEDAIAAQVGVALIGEKEQRIFFDLEEKYNYLVFDAGAADRTNNADEGEAWLTVFADGKNILEEVVSTHELPKTCKVGVSGCRRLEFRFTTKSGNEVMSDSTGGIYAIGNAYVAVNEAALGAISAAEREFPDRAVKMVSELGTFGVYSGAEKAVYRGSGGFETFSMGGVKYNEGVILLSSNNLIYDDKPACVSFNLGGKYKTVTFDAGHVTSCDVYKNEDVEIYGDGQLLQKFTVECTGIPKSYQIDVGNVRHLEFVSGKVNGKSLYRPAVGLVKMAAFPAHTEAYDLFGGSNADDYPQTADLIDTVGFYDVRNPHLDIEVGAVGVGDGYYDGKTAQNSFTVAGRTINKGVLLHTSVHLSFDLEEFEGMMALNIIGFSMFALAAAGEAHDSAFALANLKGTGYKSVTFTVAYHESIYDQPMNDEETKLIVGADNAAVKEFILRKGMAPETHTVEIGECEQLVFWLNCGLEDYNSYEYAIYDITLSK